MNLLHPGFGNDHHVPVFDKQAPFEVFESYQQFVGTELEIFIKLWTASRCFPARDQRIARHFHALFHRVQLRDNTLLVAVGEGGFGVTFGSGRKVDRGLRSSLGIS